MPVDIWAMLGVSPFLRVAWIVAELSLTKGKLPGTITYKQILDLKRTLSCTVIESGQDSDLLVPRRMNCEETEMGCGSPDGVGRN